MLDITSRGEVVLDSQLCLFGRLLPSGRAMLPKCTWRHFSVAAGVISQGRRCSSASWPQIQAAPVPRLCGRASGRGKEGTLQIKQRQFSLSLKRENATVACSCSTLQQKRKVFLYDDTKIKTHTIMNASDFTFTRQLHSVSCAHLKACSERAVSAKRSFTA